MNLLTWKRLALGLLAGWLLLAGWAGVRVLGAADAQELPVASLPARPALALGLAAALHRAGATGPTLARTFPYRAYLAPARPADALQLSRDAQLLDSLYPANGPDNERLLFTVLTDSLAPRWQPGPSHDSLAHLDGILRWAAQLPVAAALLPQRATFFEALNQYWMQHVADALHARYRRDPNLKYSFRFKHLNQLCRQAKCGVPVAFSAPEKVLNNVVESKWAYLYTKFWQDGGWRTKLGALLAGGFFLLPLGALLYQRRRR